MSATNRGAVRSPQDYYVTPPWVVRKFMDKFLELEPGLDLPNSVIFDPCAGGDELNPMTYPTVLQEYGATAIITMDIREDSRAAGAGMDFLKQDSGLYDKSDLVISNPPFKDAAAFIKKGLEFVKDGGYLAYLMRINLYGSDTRRPFWQTEGMMPKYTLVHTPRPSFIKGGSDATEYAHFVWQKGYNQPYSKIMVI